jgi:SAM-dependent methyltransferase
MDRASPASVLEVGCNAGWNLKAIREAAPWTMVKGIDVNIRALEEARRDGLDVEERAANDLAGMGHFDLIFTSGCLIHIPPSAVLNVCSAISAASRRHVLAVEYGCDDEQEIEYRGHVGRLWKRDFGKIYENIGMIVVYSGAVGGEFGFDNCRYWLATHDKGREA